MLEQIWYKIGHEIVIDPIKVIEIRTSHFEAQGFISVILLLFEASIMGFTYHVKNGPNMTSSKSSSNIYDIEG